VGDVSEEVITYEEEEKKHFDLYVENLMGFYESMKETGLITDFDIRTSLWLRRVVVEVRDLTKDETINLLDACEGINP
jgi:hypothetical protein